MSKKIEEALIKIGVEQKDVPEIIGHIPEIVINFEDNYNVDDLKKMFETLIYIHTAQNIHEKGMWEKEKNCPNREVLGTLADLELIHNYKWGKNVNVLITHTTETGEELSNIIMEKIINKSIIKEMIESIPELIHDSQILPTTYPNKFYLRDYINYVKIHFPPNFKNFIPSYYNKKAYNLCKEFYTKAVNERVACTAHYYVSTRGGEERGEYYVLSPEMTDAIAEVISGRKPKEVEQKIDDIKENMLALEFLYDYDPSRYRGLGKYAKVEENIIKYLKELKESRSIATSKDFFSSGFSSQMPYMIRDDNTYKTKILTFEKELDKQITDLLSGVDVQKTEKKPTKKTEKIPPKEPSPLIPEPNKQNLGNEIIIGTKDTPQQWGIIGRTHDSRIVKMDLNAPHVVFVCGKMGTGKGYDIGVMCEMLSSDSIDNISSIEKRGTIVVFYDGERDIPSEFNKINEQNDIQKEIDLLRVYGVEPKKLLDNNKIKIFLDPTVYDKYYDTFKTQYDSDNIQKIQIDPATLEPEDWALSLSVGNSKALYIDGIFEIIRKLGKTDCNLENINNGLKESKLSQSQKKLAKNRLNIFKEFFNGNNDFLDDLVIGGINIFDMRRMMYRPEHIFSIMTLIVSRIENRQKLTDKYGQFPVIFVINEAHKYLKPKKVSHQFVDKFIGLIKRKRHGGNWLIIDTHEPNEVDNKFVTHSDIKIIHQLDVVKESPKELKPIIKKSPKKPSKLEIGEAIITADYLLDGDIKLQNVPLIVKIRPRITKHGGATKTAIGEK